MPATPAARSIVHSAARRSSPSRPVVCSARNCLVREPVLEEIAVHRERDRQIGAGPEREMDVGVFGERRAAGIDHHERGAALLRLANERHEVDAGRVRVRAPDDDQLRLGIVRIGDAGHLAVQRERGGAGRRGADGAREARRAEAAEELGVVGVLREEAVRAAVAERQNRFARRPGP